MEHEHIERRREKRVNVEVPFLIRHALSSSNSDLFQERIAKNISLEGLYFEANKEEAYAVNDTVITSVPIPESQTRVFPFTRVAGRGRIVRINPLAGNESAGSMQYGIALEFYPDVTILTGMPSRA